MKYRKTFLSRYWKDDGIPTVTLSHEQANTLKKLRDDIASHKLNLIENCCLCGNMHADKDLLISRKERYGIAIPQVLCKKCGLIRSGLIFDDASNLSFYQKYYRDIYDYGASNRFAEQIQKGEFFYELLSENISLDEISDVCENGCGAGGILMPFHKAGKNCVGYDYDTDYLRVGKDHGLRLIEGDAVHLGADNSFDLLILSHVMEHFTHPIEDMQKIIAKVRPNKFLLIQVPGIYSIKNDYDYNPMRYFQNAHIYNFYEQYLRVFFEQLGLKVIYGDEKCTFILQRVKMKSAKITCIYDSSLDSQYRKVYRYLWRSIPYHNVQVQTIKKILYPILCLLGWRRWRKYFR